MINYDDVCPLCFLFCCCYCYLLNKLIVLTNKVYTVNSVRRGYNYKWSIVQGIVPDIVQVLSHQVVSFTMAKCRDEERLALISYCQVLLQACRVYVFVKSFWLTDFCHLDRHLLCLFYNVEWDCCLGLIEELT